MKALTKLKQSLKRKKLDALLVTQPENRRYLSGFTATDSGIDESSGVLLIPVQGEPFLLTDSRFALHAQAEATGFSIELYPKGLLPLLHTMLPKLGIKRLGFESHYMVHSNAEQLFALASKTHFEAVPLVGLIERIRKRKQEEEIAIIKKSVLLNEEVFQEVFAGLKPGHTEIEVALRIENSMRLKGAERPSFETIVAGGPNGASPHAVPSNRPLQEGEPIVIDMGLILDGYCSDMTRTIILGTPDQKAVEIFRIVRKAQLAATAIIKAGIPGKEADKAARQVISKAGYGDYFGHGLGHGVGMAVHEAPSLNPRNTKKLQPGMIITVEPGIYIPEWGGVRLENMGVVRQDGCEILNEDVTFLDI